MAEVKQGFPTPPEITTYFADKSLKPAFSWQDVWAEEHAYGFTVAKAVDTELLGVFKSSIQKAIDSGQGFDEWRKGLLPELHRLGWTGPRMVTDPSGQWKPKEVDFSNGRRLSTIFWSNVRSARAAGQWERIQRSKKALPYILYVHTTAERPRKEHLAWAGTILPADDSFWSTHFPPNGWGCKCSVRQISRWEYDKLSKSGQYRLEAPTIEERPFLNKRTGEITRVPVGIDPGWGTNPGLARAQTLVENLQARLESAGPVIAKQKVKELLETPAPKILMGIDQRLRLPVAVSTKIAEALKAKSPIIMTSNDVIAVKTGKPGVDIALDHFLEMQTYLDDGEIIDEGQEGKRSVFYDTGKNLIRIIVQKSLAGFLRITSIHPRTRKKLEAARERAAKLKGE